MAAQSDWDFGVLGLKSEAVYLQEIGAIWLTPRGKGSLRSLGEEGGEEETGEEERGKERESSEKVRAGLDCPN